MSLVSQNQNSYGEISADSSRQFATCSGSWSEWGGWFDRPCRASASSKATDHPDDSDGLRDCVSGIYASGTPIPVCWQADDYQTGSPYGRWCAKGPRGFHCQTREIDFEPAGFVRSRRKLATSKP